MDQDKKEIQQPANIPATNEEQGRKPTTSSEPVADKPADISQVDQQEGEMSNGTLGGNFGTDDSSEPA